jgi:disulfide oxidoreductase YuzD
MAEIPTDPILWLPQVEDHDYSAAGSYLSLLHAEGEVAGLLDRLKAAPIVHYKAKDIFRASRLSLLGMSNSHVAKDQRKIQKGQALSPLLLVRDEATGKVVIADGYHRLCAVYGFDEDALIPCKII